MTVPVSEIFDRSTGRLIVTRDFFLLPGPIWFERVNQMARAWAASDDHRDMDIFFEMIPQ